MADDFGTDGAKTSDAGLLVYRELDHALGLTGMAGSILSEARRGKNIRHLVEGLMTIKLLYWLQWP